MLNNKQCLQVIEAKDENNKKYRVIELSIDSLTGEIILKLD